MRLFLIFLILILPDLALTKDPLSEGFLFLEKKEYSKAFKTFSSIKKKKPFVYTAMGMSKALSGQYESAIDFLFIATKDEKESNNWVPNFFIGLSFYNLNRHKDAIPFLEKSYYLNQDYETLNLLGKSYFKIEDYKKSEEIFEKICKDKKDEEICLLLAKSKIFLNKGTEAENLLNELINLYPQNPFLLYERAKLRFKKGQIDIAEKDIENALKLTDNPEIQKIYSTIKFSKKPSKDVKINENKTSINYFLPLSILFLLILGFIFFYKKRDKNFRDKFIFAKTLLEKADYINAGNIFLELKRWNKLRNPAIKGLLTSKILLGKADEAILIAQEIKEENDRFFYNALVYLYLDDKDNFNKYLGLLEQLGNSEKVNLLKKLFYSDKKAIIDFLIQEVK